MSLAQVGIIMAIPVIIGVFTSIMWSSFSDAIGRRKPFLIQSSILMALFTFAVTLISSFEGFLILGVFRGLFTPISEGLIVTSLFRVSDYRGRATAYSGLRCARYAACKIELWFNRVSAESNLMLSSYPPLIH